MAVEVESRYWRRRYRVDEAGIAQLDLEGYLRKFISWDHISRIDNRKTVHSRFGDWICIRTERDKEPTILTAVFSEWHARSPEACREDYARRHREWKKALFIHVPLLLFGPFLLWYGLWWATGRPLALQDDLKKVNGLGLFSLFFAAFAYFHYYKWGRHREFPAF